MSTMDSPTLEIEKKRKRRKLVAKKPIVDDGASTDSTQVSVKRVEVEKVADSVGVAVNSAKVEVGDGKVAVGKNGIGVSVPNVEATTNVAPMTQGNAESSINKLQSISKDVMALAQADNMKVTTVYSLVDCIRNYEKLVYLLIAENEGLKGRLEERRVEVGRSATSSYAQVLGGKQKAVPLLPQQGCPEAVLLAPLLSKPVNTWSVVVRGKNAGSRERRGRQCYEGSWGVSWCTGARSKAVAGRWCNYSHAISG